MIRDDGLNLWWIVLQSNVWILILLHRIRLLWILGTGYRIAVHLHNYVIFVTLSHLRSKGPPGYLGYISYAARDTNGQCIQLTHGKHFAVLVFVKLWEPMLYCIVFCCCCKQLYRYACSLQSYVTIQIQQLVC